MDDKIIEKQKKIGFIVGLTLLLFITTMILIKNNLETDYKDFILEGIYFIFTSICLFISFGFKIRYLTMGWGFLSISVFYDMVDELKFIEIPEWQSYLFEGIFFGLGLLLITYGFYRSLEEKETILEELRYSVLYDQLTNLPNRRHVEKHLTEIIKEAFEKKSKAGILFIDLDRFKVINDTLGHYFGDGIIQLVAHRLKGIAKEDMVARLGGDEFILVIQNKEDIKELEFTAKKIIDSFKHPFTINEKEVYLSCSIGIATLHDYEMNTEMLFKNADIAMYKAKEAGRNNYIFYNDAMNECAEEKLKVTQELRNALIKREFILHYQPKVNIQTGAISGLEALVRWNNPELGLVYPDYFISIAEETGLIKEIDKQVLELACLQIRSWNSKNSIPVNISVNISAKLFNQRDFVNTLESILINADIDPSYIAIEITETAAMEDIKNTNRILEQLKKMNIKISLDDFGTGYSSLNYLKTFPIDELKIDKIFVDGIGRDAKDESIIEAMTTMAKNLGIKVVSEGVETTTQLNFLRAIGSDEYQGYLFSKPLPFEDIEKMLN
ncbi:diguanylate cyclase (GGDEF) domain-containing protein [Peptoclostridium litorale DSM 5388]|uniref:Signal transduction protein n=1 Tax=Peptoclostridium litorale DSM 5388 TaxID=1121324 RepID=A0A069REP8_PEPLI|nr:EAL domain-containing protein [Peptoclostridium litorale]KDR95506.1 signal transduction protein [Peptoclostridium litorale DSM 5388]SIO17251.1 diguanylate cyclase (GGDEF) domain-containing protein [Peptoclostridium litorale DSM 5388]